MQNKELLTREFVWALGSCCALHGKPFDAQLALRQFVPPYSDTTLIRAVRGLGFHAQLEEIHLASLQGIRATVILLLADPDEAAPQFGSAGSCGR